jgi:DNA-binding transcriptional LysR family regulator
MALTTQAETTVKIGASHTVGEYLVPRWLAEFRLRGDQPPVQLRVANSNAVVAALRAREIDLGFVESPAVPADLRSRRIGQDRLVLVVSPEHRLARRRRPITGRELARLRLVIRESGSGARETLERAIGEPMAEPAMELMTNSAIKVAIAAGEFAAALPELVVNQELLDGRLVEVPMIDVDMTRMLRAVWRRGTRWRGATGDFLTLVANKSQWGRPAPGVYSGASVRAGGGSVRNHAGPGSAANGHSPGNPAS